MADEGISAGKVFVAVEPRSRGFWQRFVADNQGGAAKAGDDLGDRIGKAIAARVARSVRDGLGGAGAGVGTQGSRYGNEFGGTFADAAKRRIQAALRSLPTPQVGVATTEAEQKLKDLRGELSTLAGKRIGVDIGASEALAEVRRLKTALDELAGKSPSVQVRVDAANAAIELAAVDREVSRLDGRRADINVTSNTAEAASGMQLLLNAGFALGPAIIPGAVAGAAAILSIGAAATAVAGAIGVGALAFRGIGDAVKALDTADRDAAKSNNTLVQQQKSLSSSAGQVASAEASLANTRANAADQQRRALQQIADAERQVGQAQQDATRAQQTLNDAREEERRSQQDTAFQLRQNAIDQKKAALEVAAARQAAVFGGDGNQAAVDEALLRQEELQAAGVRLADEQKRNTQTGIDGSRRVVSAQDAVVKAQERVADAERGVAEAREQAASQARQSAFAIAQAQQAVASAARAAGAATVAAAATGGAAVDKLNDALGDLPVSAQAFARFIFGLKPELLDLQAAAADGLLPGVQDGIQTLLPYVGNLRGFIVDTSTELGTLARRGAEAFTSPFWRQFFSFLASQAVPTLDTLYKTSLNVAEGGARIVQEFSPLERQVGGGIVAVSQKFLAFSQGLDRNQGFQRFIQYALTEGPHVVATIEELAKVGLHVAQAYGPVGSVVVTELRLLGQVINAIPVPVITTLATAITAYKTAALLTGGAQALLNSGLLTGIARMITYGTVTTAAGTATTGMQRGLAATSGFIGGPFLVAITAAVTVIGLLAEKQAQAKVNTDSYRSTLEDYARTFKDGVTPAALESAKAILANNQALRGLVEVTQSHGISASEVVAGLNGEAGAREKVVAAIDDHIGALAIKAAYETGDARKADQAQIASLEAMKQAFLASGANAAEAGRLTGELADEQKRANGVFDQASPTVKTLADSYKIVADATSTAAEKTNALKDAEDALFGAARSADEAAEAQAKAIRASNKTLDDRALLSEKGAKGLDLNTEAGTRLRDSLKDELTAINATYRANIANGMSIEEATRQHDAEVEALKKKVAQKGVDAGATQKLIDIYGKVPTSASTDVTVTGIGATKSQLDELLAYQLALRTGITLGEARDKISPAVKSGPGRGQSNSGNLAEGGPVTGPGTGTSDDVPAIERTTGARFQLSNGEFVQPTATVDYYGQGFMEALRRRAIPKQTARGYATGGLINQFLDDHYPYPTTTAMTKIPSKEDVAKVVLEGPSSGGREDIKAFIRSTGSLPYIWAAAGPSGYDCCLPGRTLIHGPNGPRRIDEIQSGDMVYSRDDNGLLAERKVVKAWRSVDQQTYRLKIRGRNVDASANHPFLRVASSRAKTTGAPCATDGCERPSRGRGLCATCYMRMRNHGTLPDVYPQVSQYHLEWARLDELKRGDLVVVLDEAPATESVGPEVLPDGTPITEQVAWLFGAIIGDGTVQSGSGIRLAAFGTFAEQCIAAIRDVFGIIAKPHPSAGLIASNTEVARTLLSLGFWRRGEDKRVPEIVWSWSRTLRLAFCAGYAAADGYMGRDGQSYSSCSRRLIDEVRLIHMEAGHRVSNVTTNMRRKPITIKGKLVKSAKPLHSFTVSSLERETYSGLRQGRAVAVTRDLTGGAFGIRTVLGVEPLGVEPTYDLNIDENHNFIADGVVVHNSGLASAVYGLATGKGGGHGQRYFTTFDFASGAPAGFKPGAGGVLTVGVNPLKHMAGNYGGLGFEAASTQSGIKIGNRAQKTSNFQKQFHLARGGPVAVDPQMLERLGLDVGGDPSGITIDGRVLPLGVFDAGGYLPPGLSLAYNGTGAPEPIPHPGQPTGQGDPQFDITVLLGTREITDIVDVRVERATNSIARAVTSGVRA